MLKFNLKLKFLSLFLITISLIPIAVNAQQNAEQAEQTVSTQSSSLLERLLSLFKAQENSLTTRGKICFVSPGQLGEQPVWSDRPLLVMRRNTPRENQLIQFVCQLQLRKRPPTIMDSGNCLEYPNHPLPRRKIAAWIEL